MFGNHNYSIMKPQWIIGLERIKFLFCFFSSAPRKCLSSPSVSSGDEGAFRRRLSTQAASAPASEPDPVSAASSEHAGSTRPPAAAPQLCGETEAISSAGPHQPGASVSSDAGIFCECVRSGKVCGTGARHDWSVTVGSDTMSQPRTF